MITSEIVAAYSKCTLKAYLLCLGEKGVKHEYISIIEKQAENNRTKYLNNLRAKRPKTELYSYNKMRKGVSILIDACLESEGLKAYADVLTKVEPFSSQKHHGIFGDALHIYSLHNVCVYDTRMLCRENPA